MRALIGLANCVAVSVGGAHVVYIVVSSISQ